MTNSAPLEQLDEEKKSSITISTIEVDDCPLPETENVVSIEGRAELSACQASIIIITLSGITLATSMSFGVFTIVLPAMAKDMHLTAQFLLW